VGAVRVVVVSDSHLSERTPEASANWDAVVDDLAADPPELVVHTGDLSTDGARLPADLTFARRQLDRAERTGVRVLALPGNHDVGDNPYGGHPHDELRVSPDRLARYRDAVGPDRWLADVGGAGDAGGAGGWRLVGLDAQLLGSGLPDEDDQWTWLSSAVDLPPAGPRHVALFLHKPLVDPPDRPDRTSPGRYVVPAARERLAKVLAAAPVRAVVSGHVHQFRRHTGEGLSHVWAPTTWAVVPDRVQPVLGTKACGVAELSLGSDGAVGAELRRPPGLVHGVIGDDVPDPYGL
jgi:3',5'-cyclic AMP phosphodiesterase CpdA